MVFDLSNPDVALIRFVILVSNLMIFLSFCTVVPFSPSHLGVSFSGPRRFRRTILDVSSYIPCQVSAAWI